MKSKITIWNKSASLKLVMVFLMVFCAEIAAGQLVFRQDIVQGGITAAGFSTGQGSGSGSFDIYIEPGSTIKEAYVFTYTQRYPPPAEFTLNDLSIIFDTTSVLMDVEHNSPAWLGASPIRLYFKEITNSIDPETINYSVTIPQQLGLPVNAGYWSLFLLVVYEHQDLNNTAYSIVINDKNLIGNESYTLSGMNTMNSLHPIGFSLYTDRPENLSGPNNKIYFNSNLLGVVGGSDNVNSQWSNAGVKGHFYYQSNQLFGLDDDVANNTMANTDGLANVADYLDNNVTYCDFHLVHVQYPNQPPNGTNINLAYTFAYTTPCQPFETTVTDKVENHCGDTVQLEATGGIAYEWLPQQNLSCYDCPNPIYEGDSSTFYTVRIWNTDSCSKVLPVKINIYEPLQSVNLTTTPATCGENDGALAIGAVNGGQGAYQYRFDEDWITNPTWVGFSQLAAGDYTLSVKDQNNCLLQQPFTIGEVNPAQADFTASPSSGYAPLEVDFINQSNGSNNYQWSLVDSLIHSFDFSHTFDSAGSYPVQLVSWYNLPHCADTAATTVVVHPQPPDYNHTLTFPTDYNPQHGPYLVETTNIERMEWQVFNAVGQHIYSTNVETPNGSTALWDGGGHARGYYFFRVRYWDMEGKEHSGRGKVLLIR